MSSAFLKGAAIALLACGTAANARELRVCADPNNRPFSAEDGSGMENKITELIGQELGANVKSPNSSITPACPACSAFQGSK